MLINDKYAYNSTYIFQKAQEMESSRQIDAAPISPRNERKAARKLVTPDQPEALAVCSTCLYR